MKTLTLMLAAAASLAATTARADQCAWVTPDQADKALEILAKHTKVSMFCEPCGDKAPGTPKVIAHATFAEPETGYREVSLDGTEVDLAYTYVQLAPHTYTNLARLVGCPATGVSRTLSVADESPRAVVITPSTPEPAAPPPPVAVPEPTSCSSPPPPVTNIYNHTTVLPTLSWYVVALAGFAGFLAGAAAMLAAVTVRRRRAMTPRAADLVS